MPAVQRFKHINVEQSSEKISNKEHLCTLKLWVLIIHEPFISPKKMFLYAVYLTKQKR